MKYLSLLEIILISFCLLFALSACSKHAESQNPLSPAIENLPPVNDSTGNRQIISAYNVTINPESGILNIEPEARQAGYHLPLTSYYPNCLKITGYGSNPSFWVDIKLAHPYPGSGVNAFDPRVIAIVPANVSHYFNYPGLGVLGNPDIVQDPDGYTKLFDNLGGSIAGNTNPFKAYFKNQPNRIWSSTGVTQETQRWYMNLSGFGGTVNYKLIVDVSTNYPNQSQPIIHNAQEPVQMAAVIGQGLTSKGGSAEIKVTLLDWQGKNNIGAKVESPSLFSGTVDLSYAGAGSNPNEFVFRGYISNAKLAPEGQYKLLVGACDTVSGVYIYSEFKATVEDDISFNPSDITPPWLSINPSAVALVGNYLYVGTNNNDGGLHIFDVSNPLNPKWVMKVDIPNVVLDIYVQGGYAYVTSDMLYVLDISIPQAPYIRKSISGTYIPDGIYVENGYAYIADDMNGLTIFDIDPIDSAYKVKSIDTPGTAMGVSVRNGYAYIADYSGGLQIIDINAGTVIKSLNTGVRCESVAVSGNYAYVTDAVNGLSIVNITTPESAFIVKTISGKARDVFLSGNYAYTVSVNGLNIVNITSPESAFVVKTVDTKNSGSRIVTGGGYAYVAAGYEGIHIIDIDPPESAQYLVNIYSSDSQGIYVSGNLAYSAGFSGLQILDISYPENTYVLNAVRILSGAYGIDVWNGNAFMAASTAGLDIIDVTPWQNASEIKTVDTSGQSNDVQVVNGYAYVADIDSGLQIIDIDPPETASIVRTVDTPGSAYGVSISGDYAFVADWTSGLAVVNINPPESASIVKTLNPGGWCSDVVVDNEYAYVAAYNNGFVIFDINPLNSAYIVKQLPMMSYPYKINVSDGYAYLCDGELAIIDINPPESANLVTRFDMIDQPTDVYVSANYAYVSCTTFGVRVIKLY